MLGLLCMLLTAALVLQCHEAVLLSNVNAKGNTVSSGSTLDTILVTSS